MNFELWIAFIIATAIVTSLPGPTMLLVMGHAMVSGSKKTLITICGVILADCVLLCFALLGVGAVLYSSAVAFNVMKWLGVLYLIYIGVKQWRAKAVVLEDGAATVQGESSKRMFLQGFLTTLLNPKLIGFFMAFLPQFISTEHAMPTQIAVLVSTFLCIVFIILSGYSLLAGQMRHWLRHPKTMKLMNKTSGTTLIGAGLMTATLQQQS
jgi:threonine/homoserine/homoserine lactone efflux protein